MFEVIAYLVVTVAVLAICGNSKPSEFLVGDEILEEGHAELIADPEIAAAPIVVAERGSGRIEAAVFVTDEQVATHKRDYRAMNIEELKAVGKELKVKGWHSWKKPATAIARLEAFDTDMADYMAEQAYQAHCAEIAYEASLAA